MNYHELPCGDKQFDFSTGEGIFNRMVAKHFQKLLFTGELDVGPFTTVNILCLDGKCLTLIADKFGKCLLPGTMLLWPLNASYSTKIAKRIVYTLRANNTRNIFTFSISDSSRSLCLHAMFLQDLMRYRFTHENYVVNDKYEYVLAETKCILNELDFLDNLLDDINTSIQSSFFGNKNDEVLLIESLECSAASKPVPSGLNLELNLEFLNNYRWMWSK
jgi:hypothetical protein